MPDTLYLKVIYHQNASCALQPADSSLKHLIGFWAYCVITVISKCVNIKQVIFNVFPNIGKIFLGKKKARQMILFVISPHLYSAGLAKGDWILEMWFCISLYLFAGLLFGMP